MLKKDGLVIDIDEEKCDEIYLQLAEIINEAIEGGYGDTAIMVVASILQILLSQNPEIKEAVMSIINHKGDLFEE
jgi:uncharacterized NAD-dependent epimerase/dehydratase family protein